MQVLVIIITSLVGFFGSIVVLSKAGKFVPVLKRVNTNKNLNKSI